MASSPSPAGNDAAAAPGTAQSPTFTIHIVSPSLGVPSTLSFADLPPDTTIQRLKQTIRESLDSKPADGVQRLIHRGRLLSRDDQSLLEVFGEDALRSAERQTLHLVLRDLSDIRPASTQPIPPVAAVNTPQPPASAQAPAGGGPYTQPLPQQAPIAHAQHFFPGAAQQPLMHAAIPLPNAPFGMVPPAAMGAPGAPTMPFGSHNQRAAATHHVVAQAHAAAHAQAHAAAQAQAQRQWAATMNAHMGTHATAANAAIAANMDQQLLQELINRNQRERASAGRNGAQDSQQAPNLRPPTGGNTPGQSASPFQPDGTRSVVREGVGPNGQQWRITVNESMTTPQGFQRNPRTGSPFAMADVQNIWRPPSGASHPRSVPQGSQPGGLSAFDVQQMLRTADAGQAATRAMTDAMRRNASTSSLASLANSQSNQPIPPGVTTPLIPSRSGSAAGTPDPTRAGGRASNPPTSHPLSQPASSTPEVFILSSPEGPRALLVNGGLGTYYTPPMPAVAFGQRPLGQPPLPQMPVPNLGPYFAQMPPRPAGNIWAPTPAENAALQLRNQQQQEAHAPAPPAQALPQPAAVHQHHPHPMIHQNVHIRAVALGQIWPHIWMVFRLMLFIWWFTSPSSSWTRWFTVISIAIALFLFNTGLLNPLAEQVRIPVRRHLENLMPAADNHGRRRPEGSNHDQSTGAGGTPQPADIAARLVEERRRANANWLLTQFRRLERAGILFLASIAPGVAERHIANVEAEARAERERQEAREAEAAAASAAAAAEAEGSAAAAAAAENAEASGDANAAPGGGGSASGTSPGDLPDAASSGDDGNAPRAQNPAQEPLVAI